MVAVFFLFVPWMGGRRQGARPVVFRPVARPVGSLDFDTNSELAKIKHDTTTQKILAEG